jgi:hypothetical protein
MEQIKYAKGVCRWCHQDIFGSPVTPSWKLRNLVSDGRLVHWLCSSEDFYLSESSIYGAGSQSTDVQILNDAYAVAASVTEYSEQHITWDEIDAAA